MYDKVKFPLFYKTELYSTIPTIAKHQIYVYPKLSHAQHHYARSFLFLFLLFIAIVLFLKNLNGSRASLLIKKKGYT